MSAATQNYVDELKAENVKLKCDLHASIAREAALGAKLIEFHELANLANLMEAEDVCDSLVSIDEKSPTNYLQKRDLIKQAEALEGAADEFEVHERARQCLKWNAEKLRQRAAQL